MDCNAYRILITGYLDGELSIDEIQALRAHLQTCNACLAYLKRLETMGNLLKRYQLIQEVPEIPSDFAYTISEKLRDVAVPQHTAVRDTLQKYPWQGVVDTVQRWVYNFRSRPLNWVTPVSLLVVLIVGVVFVDIFRTAYEKESLQSVTVAPEPASVVAKKDNDAVEKKSEQVPGVVPDIAGRDEILPQAPTLEKYGTPAEVTWQPDERSVMRTQAMVEEEFAPSFSAPSELLGRSKLRARTFLADKSLRYREDSPESVAQFHLGGQGTRATQESHKTPSFMKRIQDQFIEEAVFTQSVDKPSFYAVTGSQPFVNEYVYSYGIEASQQELPEEPIPRIEFSGEIFVEKGPSGANVEIFVERRFQSIAEAQKHLNVPILEPTYMLPDFLLTSVIAAKTGQGERLQLTYTNGINAISIFEDTRPFSITTSGLKSGIDVSIQGTIKGRLYDLGSLKMLNWYDTGNVQITFISDVAEDELLKIASSLSK